MNELEREIWTRGFFSAALRNCPPAWSEGLRKETDRGEKNNSECKSNQTNTMYKNMVNSCNKCTLREQKVLILIKSISNVPITLMCK